MSICQGAACIFRVKIQETNMKMKMDPLTYNKRNNRLIQGENIF